MKQKEDFLANKISLLIKEGYDKAQAYMIAKSVLEKEKKQQGGAISQQDLYNLRLNQDPSLPPPTASMTFEEEQRSIAPQKKINRILSNVQTNEPKQGLPEGNYTRVDYSDGSSDYLTPSGYQGLMKMNNYRVFMEGQRSMQQGGFAQMGGATTALNMAYQQNPNFYQLPPAPAFNKRDYSDLNLGIEAYQPTQEDIIRQNQQVTEYSAPNQNQMLDSQAQSNVRYNDINRVNIMNPYGGVGMDYALNYAGRGFGSGNPWMAGIGAGLSVLKGARNFLTGFSEAKENERVAQEMRDKQYDRPRNYVSLQQGGKIKNSDVIAQNAITDNPNGNLNLEHGEFVLRNDGQIQPVVGEPHIKNGKIADGVDAQLNEGDKVLSDYVKLKPQDIKELKSRYDISLKKGATFADAQKKLDQKLGINKLEDEKAVVLEKIEKASTIKDGDTKELSLNALTKSIGTVSEKINTLSEVREDNFNFLFDLQESQEKLGDGSQLFDKNGKEVAQEGKKKEFDDYYQQGGKKDMNPVIPPYGKEIINPVSLVQKGMDKQGNEGYYVYYGNPEDPQADKVFFTNSEFELKKSLQKPTSMYPAEYEPQLQDYFKKTQGRIGQPVSMQQGGLYVEQLAKKHNIPLERAMELIKMQEGGEQVPQQESAQQNQITQMIVESLQQGISPDEIITSLIQNGIPHEQAMQVVEQISMQMQQQEQVPQEESQYAQQGTGFSFSTRYTPPLTGYDVQGKSVLDQDTLSDVELMQPYTGKGYGAKMADVEKTMNLHDWYFDSEEKKKEFREAIVKEGEQPIVEKFQKAYNQELEKRGKEAGLKESDIKGIIDSVGFSDKGVQQLDGKYGAFTSTRPLYDFKKKDGEVAATVETPDQTPLPAEEAQRIETRTKVKNVMPNFAPYIPLFSPIQPIAKQEVAFQRLAPIKQTPEPMLAEQARQYQTEVDRVEQTGMSPQQQEAILAQGLSSSQMAANDAISKVETFNAQNQFQTDQYNAGIAAKEQIMNAQMSDAYQDKMMQTLANQEESIRNQYRTQFLQGQADSNYITSLNKFNTLSDQFAVTPSGIEYLNNRSFAAPENKAFNAQVENMTPEERERIKAQKIAETKQKYAQLGLKR